MPALVYLIVLVAGRMNRHGPTTPAVAIQVCGGVSEKQRLKAQCAATGPRDFARFNSSTVGMHSRHSTPSRRNSSTNASSRSEEHTSELQSPVHLVCRLLLEKKNKTELTPNNAAYNNP